MQRVWPVVACGCGRLPPVQGVGVGGRVRRGVGVGEQTFVCVGGEKMGDGRLMGERGREEGTKSGEQKMVRWRMTAWGECGGRVWDGDVI